MEKRDKQDQEQHDNKDLRQQNKQLEARLRGFEFLNDLYQQSKQKLKKQDQEIAELKQAVQRLSGGVLTGSVIVTAAKEANVDHAVGHSGCGTDRKIQQLGMSCQGSESQGTENHTGDTAKNELAGSVQEGDFRSKELKEKLAVGIGGTDTERGGKLSKITSADNIDRIEAGIPRASVQGEQPSNPVSASSTARATAAETFTSDPSNSNAASRPQSLVARSDQPAEESAFSPGDTRSSGSSFTIISSSNSSRKQSESDRNPMESSSVPGDFCFVHTASPRDQRSAAGLESATRGGKRNSPAPSKPSDESDRNVENITNTTTKVSNGKSELKLMNSNDETIEGRQQRDITGQKLSTVPQSALSNHTNQTGFFISDEQENRLQYEDEEEEGHVSVNIEAACDALFRAVGIEAAAMDSQLAVKISKDAVEVMKIEKKNQVMRTLLDNMSPELKKKDDAIKRMREIIKRKDETIRHLKENLRETGENESGPTSDYSEEAPTTFGPYTQEKLMVKSQLAGEGADWISVEKGDKLREANTALVKKEKEIDGLKKTVDKQAKRLAKLLEANGAWDKHCKQLETEHQNEVASLRDEGHRLKAQLQEAHTVAADTQTQNQGLREKVADLVSRVRRSEENAGSEDRALAAEARCQQLEQRLHDMQDVIDALNSDVRSMRVSSLSSMQTKTPGGGVGLQHMSRSELITQVEVLQQQVTVCAEDFEREREDRARAQAEKDELSTRHRQLTEQLRVAQDGMRRAETNLDHMTREKNSLERRLEQKITEYNLLERQLHNSASRTRQVGQPQANPPPPQGNPPRYMMEEEAPPSYHTTYNPVSPPIALPTLPPSGPMNRRTDRPTATAPQRPPQHAPVQMPPWNCPMCTFENPGRLSACDMCEQPRPGGVQNRAFDPDSNSHP